MGRLLLGSVLTGALLGTTLEATAQEKEVKQQTAPERTTSELTLEQIAEEVKKPVTDILVGCNIEWVNPDNYHEAVYQTNVQVKERQPTLVFFYTRFEGKGVDATKRLAIIFKELSKLYGQKIKFCAFDYSSLVDKEKGGIKHIENVQAIPSLAMYSTFDLVKGETPEQNDGEVKQIDILRGGPKSDAGLSSWLDGCDKRWVYTNITNPNGKYVERFNNSGHVNKINIRS